MGIKGIYREIGTGERVSLSKLAAEHISTSGHSLRIAIDISIWLFQVQASQGGASPAIRTLYFRLVRLLGLGIRPLFVFDGSNKPPFKRGAPTSSAGAIFTKPAKRLIELFGFQHHSAPGEAEAECAFLQQLGIVDMVLSEDVDTLAFGCTKTIRNWTSEGSRGSKAPTHVNLFVANEIRTVTNGLDREGLILVALMNGGDYLPAGIPGCGIKLACEAARAGFGHDLCEISPNDNTALTAWTERLCYELATNESGFFRTKHKALKIPDDFPDPIILGYHAHPLVSTLEEASQLRIKLETEAELDVKGLRDFVDEEFNWTHLSGAKKFIRQLAPSLLSQKLLQQAWRFDALTGLDERTEHEERLIKSMVGRRKHFSTDGISEIKVSYIPALIVGLDLDRESMPEEDEKSSSSDEEDQSDEQVDQGDPTPMKRSRIASWDAWAPDKAWVPEVFVRLGAPLSLERWDTFTKSGKVQDTKKQTKNKTARGGMKKGALDSYLRVTKPNFLTISQQQALFKEALGEFDNNSLSSKQQKEEIESTSEPAKISQNLPLGPPASSGRRPLAKSSEKKTKRSNKKLTSVEARIVNPWTLAQQRNATGKGKALSADNSEESSPLNPPMQNNRHPPLGDLVERPHLNTIIRKSLEGTWKGADESTFSNVTPERLVSSVSIVDMTTDTEM